MVKRWVLIALILISLSLVTHSLLDELVSYSINAVSVDELLKLRDLHEKTFVIQGVVYAPDFYDNNRIDYFYLESKTGQRIQVFYKDNSLSKVADGSFVTIKGKCIVERIFWAEQIFASSK